MQLTKIDRWLREKFVHEIHVYSLRPPEVLPAGIHAEELPDTPGRRFRHHYTARSPKAADALIGEFKQHNQMFATRVVDRKGWWVPLLAPEGRSSVLWCMWVVISAFGVLGVANVGRWFWSDPEFRKNALESLEILKG